MNRIHSAVDIVEAPSISADNVYTCDSSCYLIMYSILRDQKVIPGNAPGIVTKQNNKST